jgi:hypothetical protein
MGGAITQTSVQYGVGGLMRTMLAASPGVQQHATRYRVQHVATQYNVLQPSAAYCHAGHGWAYALHAIMVPDV